MAQRLACRAGPEDAAVRQASRAVIWAAALLLGGWGAARAATTACPEHFAAGHLKLDAGIPVTRLRYALFLTCEVVGDERIRKVRVMLVREDHLKDFPYPDALPRLENPWHDVRVHTLRAAARLLAAEPDNFLLLEVCV